MTKVVEGNGALSLNKSEARRNGLAKPVNSDPLLAENGLYFLTGFHDLHCTVRISLQYLVAKLTAVNRQLYELH